MSDELLQSNVDPEESTYSSGYVETFSTAEETEASDDKSSSSIRHFVFGYSVVISFTICSTLDESIARALESQATEQAWHQDRLGRRR